MLLGVVSEKRWDRLSEGASYHQDHVKRDARFLAQSSKKRLLSRLVVFFMPLFPLVNILQYVSVFDRDTAFIAYQFLGVVTKLLFLSTLSDAHISLTQTINVLRLSAEESANATRKTFLHYVFNEGRKRLISPHSHTYILSMPLTPQFYTMSFRLTFSQYYSQNVSTLCV